MGISVQQFQQMKARVSGAARVASPALETGMRRAPAAHQVVLGVDPSLRGTGYGVIKLAKPHPLALAHGTISCSATWERSRCLVKILQELRGVIKKHKPTVCVIEGLFYAQNLQTALIMGEARGAALAAIAEAGIEIYELAPRKVKQAIVGYGRGAKAGAWRKWCSGCCGWPRCRRAGRGRRAGIGVDACAGERKVFVQCAEKDLRNEISYFETKFGSPWNFSVIEYHEL